MSKCFLCYADIGPEAKEYSEKDAMAAFEAGLQKPGMHFSFISSHAACKACSSKIDNHLHSNCFIATALCGTGSQEVKIISQFRDAVILHNVLGRLFVRTYYKISPFIATLIDGSPKAKYLVSIIIVSPLAKMLGRKNHFLKTIPDGELDDKL